MKDAIPKSHPIRDAIVDGFNGKLIGQRVYWVASKPADGKAAQHGQPYYGRPPHIRITDSNDVTAIDKWASAMFELYNLEGDFNSLGEMAANGTLSRDEFVRRCIALEATALSRTRNFFRKNPLPSDEECFWYNYFVGDGSLVNPDRDVEDVGKSNAGYFKSYFDSIEVWKKKRQQWVVPAGAEDE